MLWMQLENVEDVKARVEEAVQVISGGMPERSRATALDQ